MTHRSESGAVCRIWISDKRLMGLALKNLGECGIGVHLAKKRPTQMPEASLAPT